MPKQRPRALDINDAPPKPSKTARRELKMSLSLDTIARLRIYTTFSDRGMSEVVDSLLTKFLDERRIHIIRGGDDE